MKPFLFRNYTLFLLFQLLFCSIAFSQSVTDPSRLDPSYNTKKAATAQKNLAGAEAQKSNRATADIVPACNVDNGCFIPFDDTYTEIPRNDDGFYGPISLPFAFNLYGTNYNQVWINTNGNLTFTDGYYNFVPSGFPIDVPMVAAFWSDVDTRGAGSGAIHYKLTETHLIVTWDAVGYYPEMTDKLNTFQIIIGVQGDPLLGPGNNVKLSYKDMQWAYAPATQTEGPTTVGVNKGDNSAYIQVGRFLQGKL